MSTITDLVWDWDPFGVADSRNEIPDEYEDLEALTIRALASPGGRDEIRQALSTYLANLGLSDFGLDGYLDALLDEHPLLDEP